MKILETNRLILRTWQNSDIDPMVAIDQDPKVCEYLPSLGNRADTEARTQRIMQHYNRHGYGLYAVELKSSHEFIGWVGLSIPSFEAHFTPAVEIGWRLASRHWNQGYATEAAEAVLIYAFGKLGMDELVSFTAVNNQASRRVMEKLGMHHNPQDDFDHPKLDVKSPLCRHVLYRLSKKDFQTIHEDKIVKATKDAYDKIAETWNREREWYIEQPSIIEAMRHLQPNAKVLDVGCGSGKPIAQYLLEHHFDVYGLDISSQQIKYAEKIIPKEKLFVADIRHFSTPIRFDAIFCWFTLFHIHANQHLSVLKKLRDLLTKNGVLLITFADTSIDPQGENITVADDHTIISSMFGQPFYHSGNSSEVNTMLIIQAGFEIISNKCDQPGNQVILAKKIVISADNV